MEKIFLGMFLLLVGFTFTFQQDSRVSPDTIQLDTVINKPTLHPTDRVKVQKIDTVAIVKEELRAERKDLITDIKKTATRAERKIEQIPKVVDSYILAQSRKNSLKVEEIPIIIPEKEFPYPEMKVDSLVQKRTLITKLFWFLHFKKEK